MVKDKRAALFASALTSLHGKDYPVYALLTGLRLLVLAYSGYFLAPLHAGPEVPLALLSLFLIMPALFDQVVWFSLIWVRRPYPAAAPAGLRVAVAITFVAEAESIEMLARTLQAVVSMSYPHDTWVLDENDEPAVHDLCLQLGVQHFTRKNSYEFQAESGPFQRGYKHGNYNAWLHQIGFEKYDIIATFDPDHVPQREFLDEVLGYFNDPAIGYAQAAQAYYNQNASFIARGAAEETYAYHAIVQTVASRFGYPALIGCHNVHRVAALKQVGGFPPHAAEDLLLTLNYRAAGWRGIYVPKILARGLAPTSWRTYIDQQRRWARSVLDLKVHRPSSMQHLSPVTWTLGLLQGIRYLLDGFFVLAVVAALVLICTSAVPISPFLAVAGLYSTLLLTNVYQQRFYLDPTSESGMPWRAFVLRLVKWPYTFAAVLDVLRGSEYPYNTTPKQAELGTHGKALMLPQLAIAGCVSVAWALGFSRGRFANPALHLCPALSILLLSGVTATAWMKNVPAYDPALKVRAAPRSRLLVGVELLIGIVLSLCFLGSSMR